MKTTITIPEPLYRRAELLAAGHSATVEQFVITVLEHELATAGIQDSRASAESARFTLDEHGFPVLCGREGATVTDELVNRIREEEGI